MYEKIYTAVKRRRRRNRIIGTLILSFLVIALFAVGATVAYLSKQAEVVNTFEPGKVTCKVTEEFDGSVKKNVNVINTGNTDAYLRVKLVTYRVNEKGEKIGGTAEIPAFTPGDGWFAKGGFYYYSLPVNPGEKPDTNLINSIEVRSIYKDADDPDGGKQVIEVMAEAIQSTPADAVVSSWNVAVDNMDGHLINN